jgi:hypothetical protein
MKNKKNDTLQVYIIRLGRRGFSACHCTTEAREL